MANPDIQQLIDDVQQMQGSVDRLLSAAGVVGGNIYPDTTTGLNETPDGEYFSVPSSATDEFLNLYRNNAGSADLVQTFYTATDAVIDHNNKSDNVHGAPAGLNVMHEGYLAAEGGDNGRAIAEEGRTNTFVDDQRIGGLTGATGNGLKKTIQTSVSDYRHVQQGGNGRVAKTWNAYWDNSSKKWKGIVSDEPHVILGLGNQRPVGGTDEVILGGAYAVGADTAITWGKFFRIGARGLQYGSPSGGFKGDGKANFVELWEDGNPVVESGSNSDGEWTRWADGTQICAGAYDSGNSKSFPKNFNSAPRLVAVCKSSNEIRFAMSKEVNASDFKARSYTENGISSSLDGEYIAYGRWF